MVVNDTDAPQGLVEALFKVGAHLGYSRSRRHASMKGFVFGSKGKTDILDLTKTATVIEESLAYVRAVGAHGKTVLFVGGKPEIQDMTREAAVSIAMPYVAGRWIGGTLSNFPEIKKRLDRMHTLMADRESGTLAKKYTKKERVMIDREIARLEGNFGGISQMTRVPDAVVVVDTRAEMIAVKEAKGAGISVIGIMNSDCDLSLVAHPLIGNDASRASVKMFLDRIVNAYQDGQKGAVVTEAPNS
jgi:small subunit ribosomal protein S2